MDEIKEIGIGSPGTPDIEKGVVLYSNNLGWDMVPLREELNKYIDKPVYLDNDANCAALGEFLAGAASGLDSAVILTFGTGIGGGVILNDRIWSGFNYAGGELGHVVIKTGGQPCTCGRNGCWEAYASMTGVIRRAMKRPTPIRSRNLQNCAPRALNSTVATSLRWPKLGTTWPSR